VDQRTPVTMIKRLLANIGCNDQESVGGINSGNGDQASVDRQNSGEDNQVSASRQNIKCNDQGSVGGINSEGWRLSICRQTELSGG